MGADSKIEWTDHTFNPVWGCEKVSPACTFCYAETLDKRIGGHHWAPGADRRVFGAKHWNEPLKWNSAAAKAGEMRSVFCASMADVFEDHPTWTLERPRLYSLIDATPQLRWLLLTKRPENMRRFSPAHWRESWPANVVAMATVENRYWMKDRLDALLAVPALHGISYEPALGPLDAEDIKGMVDWVIAGGESGVNARPSHPQWFRAVRDDCKAAGIPFFFKQWGEWAPAAGISGLNAYECVERDCHWFDDDMKVFRVGKKAAGRMLDGREWNEFPWARAHA